MALLVLPNTFGAAAANMAIDAALLATVPKNTALLRHYGWIEPSITFGYTQAWADVQASFPDELRLCRRMTGGGIVDHRNDWTYALILQASLAAAQLQAPVIYEHVHSSLAAALEAQSIASQFAPCPRHCQQQSPSEPAHCFTQPVANDVLTPSGRKIAGAAMKRSRSGLLIQGSVDRTALPDNFDSAAFAQAFSRHLSARLDIPAGQCDDLRPLFDGKRIQQERTRYESCEWQQRR